MKKFEAPEMEVVYFNKNDIIVTSICDCHDCPQCEEGSNDCPCVDPWSANYKG